MPHGRGEIRKKNGHPSEAVVPRRNPSWFLCVIDHFVAPAYRKPLAIGPNTISDLSGRPAIDRLGSAILEHKFTKPADSAVNALMGMITLIPVYKTNHGHTWWLIFLYCLLFLHYRLPVSLSVAARRCRRKARELRGSHIDQLWSWEKRESYTRFSFFSASFLFISSNQLKHCFCFSSGVSS